MQGERFTTCTNGSTARLGMPPGGKTPVLTSEYHEFSVKPWNGKAECRNRRPFLEVLFGVAAAGMAAEGLPKPTGGSWTPHRFGWKGASGWR